MANFFVDPTVGTPLTGTLTFTFNSSYVDGVDTHFTSEVSPYDFVRPDGGLTWWRVGAVLSDTKLSIQTYKEDTITGTAKVNKGNGSSPANAAASLRKIVGYGITRNPGDVVYLRRGQTYYDKYGSPIYVYSNGAAEAPITIMGDDGTGWPGEESLSKPIIDCLGVVTSLVVGGLGYSAVNYWSLKDFEFIHSAEINGPVQAKGIGIVFEKVDFHDNQLARKGCEIYAGSTVTFTNCTLHDNSSSTVTGYDILVTGSSEVWMYDCKLDAGAIVYPWGILFTTAASTFWIKDSEFGTTIPFKSWDIRSAVGGTVYVDNVTFTKGTSGVEVLPWPESPVTLTIQIVGGGTTDPEAGEYEYAAGTEVQVEAFPSAGWLFDHWTLNGENVGSANPYVFEISEDSTLVAYFTETSPPLPGSLFKGLFARVIGKQ